MIERKLINDNLLTIVGTLTDATINVSTAANGKDYVRGSVNVKSNDKTISLNFFTMKLTKENTVSKLYNTYSTLDTLRGKRVRITGYIDEAKVPTNGQIRRGNSLYLRFINVLSDTDATPDSATFKVAGFVQEGLKAMYDDDGATIKDYVIVLGQADYKNSMTKQIRLNVDKTNQMAVNSLNEKFTKGVSCVFNGNLDFDIETITTEEPQDFGPAIHKTIQRSIKRYVISSGSIIPDETAYTQDEINELNKAADEDDATVLKTRGSVAGTGGTVTAQQVNKSPYARPKLI